MILSSKRKTAVSIVWWCVAFLVLLAGIDIGNNENGAVVFAANEGEVGLYIHAYILCVSCKKKGNERGWLWDVVTKWRVGAAIGGTRNNKKRLGWPRAEWGAKKQISDSSNWQSKRNETKLNRCVGIVQNKYW